MTWLGDGSHPPWLLLAPGLQAVILLRSCTEAGICTIPIMSLRSLTLQQEKCIAADAGLHLAVLVYADA